VYLAAFSAPAALTPLPLRTRHFSPSRVARFAMQTTAGVHIPMP